MTATRRRTRKRKKVNEDELALPLPIGAGLHACFLFILGLLGTVFYGLLYVDVHFARLEFLHDPDSKKIAFDQGAFADGAAHGFYLCAILFIAVGILARRRWAYLCNVVLVLIGLGEGIFEFIKTVSAAKPSALGIGLSGLSIAYTFIVLMYWLRSRVSDAFV